MKNGKEGDGEGGRKLAFMRTGIWYYIQILFLISRSSSSSKTMKTQLYNINNYMY